jgi:cell division protein FtsI/penicillin-binding protein 2
MRLGDGNYITRGARDIIYDYFYNRYRFGRSTGVELSGESKGLIISPSSVQGNAVRYSNMVFGQGFDATMIQVSSAFSAIVNGGTYHAPTIIEGKMVSGKLAPAKARESYGGVVSANSSQTIRDMVYRARQEFYAGNDRPGFYIGGKTGTSQTIENGSYMNDQTIATYLGFGGGKGEIPRYVIMVEISGKGMNMQGSRDALPIFTDISNWMIDYLKLQPKG